MSSESKPKFPTEMVKLPSEGYFYSDDNAISSGEIEMKYMTAREEDILTSKNLIQNGTVIDKLLQSMIVTSVNVNNILLGDKNAILIASRILGYGKDYNFEATCPSCGTKSKDVCDLTQFDKKDIDLSQFEKGVNEFEYTLPASKRVIKFRLITWGDEKAIEQEIKAMKKVTKSSGVDPEITTRLKKSIISVDGDDSRQAVINFVDNEFLAIDSRSFRDYLQSVSPDVDMSFNFECSSCGHEEVLDLPMTTEFFWPAGRR